ncbi:hypothetical protein GCM10009760_49700 [Kitasatospora kazusensis]|uniref:Methyltransferase domain-containing protein n=1 Tax=Kitasatospora kazusensis TaxID=407974 RepID=A0ABP5LRU9_9ACTN
MAARCEALLACDREETALAQARTRLAGLANVTLQHRLLPGDWPEGRFDLIVLSELLYYFTPDDSSRLLDLAVESLEPAGTLLLVHWRPAVAEHAQSGDAVHRQARAHAGLVRIAGHDEPDFLLHVFVRSDALTSPDRLSVAALEGLR